MEITPAAIPDVLIVRPKRHGDARGFFSETYKASAFRVHGADLPWVQDNHSRSAKKGVVRALHFQAPPYAQSKLVRCIRGAILDVAVDIRAGSPTFGKHVAVELSEENWTQLFIPAGFAHGFCTLTGDAEVIYKVDHEYAPAAEGGIHWRDPDLAIAWPVREMDAILAARDHDWPRLRDFASPFRYEPPMQSASASRQGRG
ncbi:MAG: dTDP-4-dehydrorhamnose 3,5-epimerase [Hyphomonadaceae bacterium]